MATTGTNKVTVKQYMGNVFKSVSKTALDIAKNEYFPNASSTLNSVREVKEFIRDWKGDRTTAKAIKDTLDQNKTVQTLQKGLQNALEDLKTGNFVNEDRNEKAMNDEFGFSEDDFGLDLDGDIEESLGGDDYDEDGNPVEGDSISLDAKLNASVTQKSAAKSTSILSKTIATSAKGSTAMLIEYDKAKTAATSAMLSGLFAKTNENLGVINSNIAGILSFHNEVTKEYYSNALGHMEESKSYLKDIMGYIKETTEMQRNQYKDFLDRKTNKESQFNQVFSSNGLDLKALGENMGKNLFGGGGLFGGDNMMMSMMLASPLMMPISMMLGGVASKGFKKIFKSIDTMFGDFPKAMNYRFRNMRNSDSLISRLIGKIFYMDNSVRSNVDTSNYNKGAIPFDGETKRAIVSDIAPTLRRIEAAITGKPYKNFNLKTGQYESIEETTKRFNSEMDSALLNDMYDSKAYMSSTIRKLGLDSKTSEALEKNMTEVMKAVVKSNVSYDPNKKQTLKGISSKDKAMFDMLLNNMNDEQKLKFIAEIERTRGTAKNYMNDIEQNLGSNGFSILFDKSISSKSLNDSGVTLSDFTENTNSLIGINTNIRDILMRGLNVKVLPGEPFKYNDIVKGPNIGGGGGLFGSSSTTTGLMGNRAASISLDGISMTPIDDDIETGIMNKIKGMSEVDGQLDKAADGIYSWMLHRVKGDGKGLTKEMILDFLRRNGKNAKAKFTQFAAKFGIDPTESIDGAMSWFDSVKAKSSDVFEKAKGKGQEIWNKAVDFAAPGLRGLQGEERKQYLDRLKNKAVKFGKGAGASIFAGIMMGSPLLGVLGSVGSFIATSDRAKDWLFGKVGKDGKREGGKISKEVQDYVKNSLGSAGVGAGLGFLASGTFLNSFGLTGPILGASIGFLSRSQSVQRFLFGGTDKEGNKVDGIISEDMQKAFKKYMPSMGIGLLGGGLLGRMMGFGPLGAIATGMVGAGIGFASKSEKVQNWLYGEIGEDGKRKNDGFISKVQKYAKQNMPTIAGGLGGALLGGLSMGPLGALFLGGLGAGAGFITTTDSFKNYLFGDIDPETNKRKGGLIGTIRDNIKEWFTTAIKNPFKEALQPLKNAFGEMKKTVTDAFKAGWKAVTDSIGQVFHDAVGKPFKEVIEEKITKPLKGMITKIVMGAGKLLGFVLSAPIKGITGFAKMFTKDKDVQKDLNKMDKTADKSGGLTNFGTNAIKKMKNITGFFTNLGGTIAGFGANASAKGANMFNNMKNSIHTAKNNAINGAKGVFNKAKGGIKGKYNRMMASIKGFRFFGNSGTAQSGVAVNGATINNAAGATTTDGGDGSVDPDPAQQQQGPGFLGTIGNIISGVANAAKKAGKKITGAVSGGVGALFGTLFGKLTPSKNMTPMPLVAATQININRFLPAIHKELKNINSTLKNGHLKTIKKEVYGQLDGVGYNMETVANILEEHYGSPKIPSTKMKVTRGNKKRRGLAGKILSFAMAPFSFLIGKPLAFIKNIGGRVLGGIMSAIKAPFSLIGHIFGLGKKGLKGIGLLGKYLFVKPISFAFKMVGKTIVGAIKGVGKVLGGIKDLVVGGFNLVGSALKAVGTTIGALANMVLEGVKVLGTTLVEGVKTVGTAIRTMIPIVGNAINMGLKSVANIVSSAWNGFKNVLSMFLPSKWKRNDVNIVGGTLDNIVNIDNLKNVDNVKEVEKVNEVTHVNQITFVKSIGGIGGEYIKKAIPGLRGLDPNDKKIVKLATTEDEQEGQMRDDISTMAKNGGGILGGLGSIFKTLGGPILGVLGTIGSGLSGLIPGLKNLLPGAGGAGGGLVSTAATVAGAAGMIYAGEKANEQLDLKEEKGEISTIDKTARKTRNRIQQAGWAISAVKAIGAFLKRVMANPTIQKAVGKYGPKLMAAATKLIAKLESKLGVKILSKATRQGISSGAKSLMSYIPLINLAIYVDAFTTGYSYPQRFLNLPSTVKPTIAMKLASGIGYLISTFIFELDDLLKKDETEPRFVISFLYGLLAREEEEEETKNLQNVFKQQYEDEKEINPDISFDEFNKLENATWKESVGMWVSDKLGTSTNRHLLTQEQQAELLKEVMRENPGISLDQALAKLDSPEMRAKVKTLRLQNKEENIKKAAIKKAADDKRRNDIYDMISYGNGRFGRGNKFVSQNNMSGVDMTIPGDYEKVSGKDVGCGPAAFTMALDRMGYKADPKDMMQLAKGYRLPNDGTDYQMFSDVANSMGMSAYNQPMGAGLLGDLSSGKPAILMGEGGAFGPGTHYMMADGYSNGKVRINDPLSSGPKYTDAANLFKKTKNVTRFGNGPKAPAGLLAAEETDRKYTSATPSTRKSSTPTNQNDLILDSAIAAALNNFGKYIGKLKYEMGAKSPKSGKIDCSGWVQYILRCVRDALKQAKVQLPEGWEKICDEGMTAAGITAFTNKLSGLASTKLDTIRPDDLKNGMIIAFTPTSAKEIARTQTFPFKINHILFVYKDTAGKMWITESRGGKGTLKMPVSEFAYFTQNKKTVYIGDPFSFMRASKSELLRELNPETGTTGSSAGGSSSSSSGGLLGLAGKFIKELTNMIAGSDIGSAAGIGMDTGGVDAVDANSSGGDTSGTNYDIPSLENEKNPAVKVEMPDTMTRIYTRKDGTKYMKKGGTFAWRNNNPGNVGIPSDGWDLKFGRLAKAKNSVSGYNFGVYPSEAHGTAAKEHLLFGKDKYKNSKLLEAMKSYAPKDQHGTDPIRYFNHLKEAGVPTNKYLKDFTPAERSLLIQKIAKEEGYGANINNKQFKELGKGRFGAGRFGRGFLSGISDTINNYTGGLTDRVNNVSDSIRNVGGYLSGGVDSVGSIVDNGFAGVNGIIDNAKSSVTGVVDNIATTGNNFIGGIFDKITSLKDGVMSPITDLGANALDSFNNMISTGAGIVSGVTSTIGGAVDTFASMPEKIIGTVTEGIGAVVDKFKESGINLNIGGAGGSSKSLEEKLDTMIQLLSQLVTNTTVFNASEGDMKYNQFRHMAGLPIDQPYNDGSTIELAKKIVKRRY